MGFGSNPTFLRQEIEKSREKIDGIRQGRVVGNLKVEEIKLQVLMDEYAKFFSHLK